MCPCSINLYLCLCRLDNGYSTPAITAPHFNNLRNIGIQNSVQKKIMVTPSFGNYSSYENTNGISSVVDPSHCLPLLPHGGTKLAFRNTEMKPRLISGQIRHSQHPPLQLYNRFDDAQSNQYEVPFSQFSSANNLINHVHQTSFQPTSNTFSRSKTTYNPYKDICSQNIGDSLPSILDSSWYIQNSFSHNDNLQNYVSRSPRMDDRVQPQGSSSPNSVRSNKGIQNGNKFHGLNTTNHLGNI